MPSICSLLKGKMRTEQQPARSWYDTGMFVPGDEAVILFRIAAGGMAHLHQGQDARVNVHLCLLNCAGSSVVAAGSQRHYSDGSLFAFEDRADHEIINTHPSRDRISLTVGVLHPDLVMDAHPSPHRLLHYVINGSNTVRTWKSLPSMFECYSADFTQTS